MAEEYFSAGEEEDVPTFNIYDKIIDRKDENTYFIKLSFREVLAYTKPWCFNRVINEEKVIELYNELCHKYIIPYQFQAVHDRFSKDILRKVLILDGQHRIEAIRRYIEKNDLNMDCTYSVWICVYEIENSESKNTNEVIELFKKINKNRIFDESELPDTFIVDTIKRICEVPSFRKNKVIRNNIATNTCHAPYMHIKELNSLLTNHKDIIKSSNKSIEELVENIVRINHIISMKAFDDLYLMQHRNSEKIKYQKALSIGFFLNMKKSKYPPEVWVSFISNPDNMI